jgi:hypothetical protein
VCGEDGYGAVPSLATPPYLTRRAARIQRLTAHTAAVAAELHAAPRAGSREAAVGGAPDLAVTPLAQQEQELGGLRGAMGPSVGFAAGIRSVIDRFVDRFVAEGWRGRAEAEASLAVAMQRISNDIVRAGVGEALGGGAEGARPAEGATRVLLDEEGCPLSVGVLCYDEVQMMDIADATILSGVLQSLLRAGWVLVATCNRAPEQFTASTLHREHPQARFSESIRTHCDTFRLGSAGRDYREELVPAADVSFFCPDSAGEGTAAASPAARLDRCFEQLTRGMAVEEDAPIAAGRHLRLLAGKGVARASFERLCGTPLGAGDFVALAQRYHTVCVEALPQLSMNQRDKARRFITLVDQIARSVCGRPPATLGEFGELA